MLPPSNIKEIQRLTRRIAALSRFVAKASDKCQPFFQVLKKALQWDAHYKEAFTALKTYLSSPLVLVSPLEGELLTLYLAVLEFSTSAALVKERDKVQQPVYYCSRALSVTPPIRVRPDWRIRTGFGVRNHILGLLFFFFFFFKS